MEWKIDRTAKTPIYKQIMNIIEQKIAYREFPPGSLLPPERTLSKQLKVNRMTIVRVYEELVATGLIVRKQGSGTRVNTHNWGSLPSEATNWKRYVEGGTFLPMSPIVKRIRTEANRGKNVYDLASEDLPPDLSPPHLSKYFQDIEGFFSTPDEHPQGQLQLRETIVQHMKEYYNLETTSSSVIVTSGIHQSVYLITQCLLSPGDAVALESPSYLYSLPLFQSAGIRIFDLPVDENGINPDDILTLHRKHQIKFIFSNPTFQSPTGTVLSEERRKRICEISAELNIPIAEGDPYTPLSFIDTMYSPIKKYDKNGNVLFIGSLAKSVSNNLGIGWIIGPRSVIDRISDARQQMDFGVNIFSQSIARNFLQSKDYSNHLASLKQKLKERRDEMVVALNEELGKKIEFNIPDGGFFIWVKIKNAVNDRKLVAEGIKNKVLFMPGSALGVSEGYVRLSFARLKKEDIKEAIRRFAQSIDNV